jgi:hypothetical protein
MLAAPPRLSGLIVRVGGFGGVPFGEAISGADFDLPSDAVFCARAKGK